jgi:hypothetical protein
MTDNTFSLTGGEVPGEVSDEATDRSAAVTIGGQGYELLLTVRATKEIAKRYGGLEKLGESLLQKGSMDEMLEEVVWLVTLLANQAICRHNLLHGKDSRELLTPDFVEIMTDPSELAAFKGAVTEALFRGTARHVNSEEAKQVNNPNALSA